ncbi:V-type proton ATPase subunit C 1 [Hypsizygus marmoreus]|uniref:V-type proton ATPase subunit C n=1 Tax=Hypsizygus marmoreus TaxID=39966 RepID=A0A369K3J5_HYPMA|nr:V-type proton ATPase subunit C 1 [Hypsizygus marmoreus]
MPSDQSTWLIAVPNDGEAEGLLQELHTKLSHQSKSFGLAQFDIPSFKTGTLDNLVALSEDIPKQDAFFTATVARTVDTLRSLLNNDPSKLAQHILVDENNVDDYLLRGWRWNEGRYGAQKGLQEIVDSLGKEMTSIDNAMKAKLNNYNLVKGSLTQMQRKKMGNLSVRSLADVVSKDDFIHDSEYLETLLVAVPKALVKDWKLKYERLTTMVVPRSSTLISSDDEFSLFGVVVFRRVHDEFVQACRENKFIVRDFVYSEDELAKQREDLDMADTTEKELWTELLRLSRTNFSESFQILVHLKVVRLFVESVLRYGLPANYIGLVLKPDSKSTKKIFNVLQAHFAYLSPRSNRAQGKKGEGEEFVGEYQSLMDQDFFDFVLFEVPWIVN